MQPTKRFNLTATWKKLDRKISEHNQRIGPTGRKLGKTCKEKIKAGQRAGMRDILLAYVRACEKRTNQGNCFWVTLSYLAKMSEETRTDRTCGNHIDKACQSRILVLGKTQGRKNFGNGRTPCLVIRIDTSLLVFDDPQLQLQFEGSRVDKSVDELSAAQAKAIVQSLLKDHGASAP